VAVSRGIGVAQREILDYLSGDREPACTVVSLAYELDRDERQIRRAIRSLERRGLVAVTKMYGRTPVAGGRWTYNGGRSLWVWLPGKYAEWLAAKSSLSDPPAPAAGGRN
jgi:hypothetical protein